MSPVRLPLAALLLVLVACTERRATPPVADTTSDRPDSTELRRPSPTDTVDGASLQDTVHRARPSGMRRPEGAVSTT